MGDDVIGRAIENCERKLALRTEQVEEMWASGDEEREVDFAVAVNASDLRDLLALARSNSWQPIETAPMDREILLFIPDHGPGGPLKPYITLGSYLDNSKTQWPRQGWKSSTRGPVKPTHWRPMPEPLEENK